MKQTRYFWTGAAMLVALMATLLLTLPTSASRSSPPLSAPSTSRFPPPHSPTDHLIALPVVLPDPEEIPPNLTPEQAAEYARGLTYRQARPILAELERLQAEGLIAGFEVQPTLHGVAVRGGTPEALEQLSRLQGVAAVLSIEDEPPACAVAAAEALPDQVSGLSQMAAGPGRDLKKAPLSSQATDPSIDVYVYVLPGGTWTYVSGRTTPNTAVTMRILRGSRVIASDATTSRSSGYYYFYPSWHACPTWGYDWTLRPGDVVEVTAHGDTVSTVVAHLSAWVDPDANTVAGSTDPGRSVEVRLYNYGSDPCSGTSYSQLVSTDGSGNFSADFSSVVDFDRRALSTIYARDANGNSTYATFYAYRIAVRLSGNDFYGYLKPEVDFTATLSRTGSIVSTDSGKSSASGYYYGWFTDTIRPGDVVRVSGGGVSIEYTATSLDVTMDRTANKATGTTGANRRVKANFYKRTWGYYVSTSCSWSSTCAGTTADAGGNFTLDAGLDLVRGDYADFYVYDAEGNYQYAHRPVPAIVARLTWNEVSGYWGDPNAGYVTVTLKDSGGAVKYTESAWVDSYDGEFDAWMGWSAITPNDIIEVTDGIVTETMTVQNLTARLDGGTGHLTGSAYNDHLLAKLDDFRRDSEYLYGYCSETTVSGGTYDLTFDEDAQVGGQDDAAVWSTGPDGHYTHRYARAFTVNAQEDDDYVWGYSETPYTPITITLKSGATTKAVYTTTSWSNGYYYVDGSATITQGDTLVVQTGDGDSVSLPIPELTVQADAAQNRLYGRSPANEPVQPQVWRWYSHGRYGYSQHTTADAAGNYSADFDGLYWWRDCSAVDVGHRCSQPAVSYYNSDGHRIWLEGPKPSPVGADIYESDDISTTASVYIGVQSHTFHTTTDTDWITFTVPAEDVAASVPYRIETFNLGWGMATRVDLYDTDGTTLLQTWTGYEHKGQGVLALWTPSNEGTYYLKLSPPSSSYAAYCDAAYDLMILPVRAQTYLPLVAREY